MLLYNCGGEKEKEASIIGSLLVLFSIEVPSNTGKDAPTHKQASTVYS